MTVAAGRDLLAAIVASVGRSVKSRETARPLGVLERTAHPASPGAPAFRRALADGVWPRVVAECKRRSPSRGVLRADYDPAAIAREYERAGAAALSVLTEPSFFDGSLEHLRAVRSVVRLPVLCKDFVVTHYQVFEAADAGADAVLLIVAALAPGQLRALHTLGESLGLAALVEVHDERELDVAMEAGASILGVNSRNLRTLEVDLAVARRLASRLPAGAVRVAESGLRTPEDLTELSALGYDAFLVGERFMAAADPGAALRELRAAGGRGER